LLPENYLSKECNTMPYLFKLSQRVARLRGRVVLVAAGLVFTACEASDPSLSAPTHPSFVTSTGAPAGVTDLAVAATTDSSATLIFTEVDDGTGAPARYDVRVAPTPLNWGTAVGSVKRGTCVTPVVGTAIGTRRTCTVLGLVTGTAYDFQLVSFRGTLNLNAVFGPLSNVASGTARTVIATAPGTVSDLAITGVADSGVTLAFTEVTDGAGAPASYDIRAVAGTSLAWGGSAPSVSRGSCATPVVGTAIGAKRTCTVLGLMPSTTYSFQLVAYRGTLRVNAVFGELSNQASGTTAAAGSVAVASVSVAPGTATLANAGTQQLVATLKDASGNVLTGRTVSWASSNAAVAPVNAAGLVSGVAAGSVTITATSGGRSGTAAITVAAAPATSPGTVSDLKVAAVTDTSVTLAFTEVIDGTGAPASYDIRVVAGTSLAWGGSATSVSRGSCATPVVGTAIGARRTCTVLGLTPSTTYSFQLVAYRGTLRVNAVFGALSNQTSGTTSGSTPLPPPPPSGSGVTYYRTNFTDGTTGPLDVYAYGGGSCAKSADYRDPGSAYSMKCTIPAIDYGAAALQAWFGNGRLSGTPKDPSLDQDLFQEVRFVFAPSATQAIGSTSCIGSNSTTQIKVHKSVYGQAGSAWNGWVMSEIAPCMDGPIGMFSEPEMWNVNGTEFTWPGTFPSIQEGTVYDVIYRYHRYSAQGCGTIAIWVNGAKVMDSPCWSYMGTTNGSAQGLLFWDGATYLQNGLAALSVYTLFTQATNYPIGAATASR
jgi:hypothetical protein